MSNQKQFEKEVKHHCHFQDISGKIHILNFSEMEYIFYSYWDSKHHEIHNNNNNIY